MDRHEYDQIEKSLDEAQAEINRTIEDTRKQLLHLWVKPKQVKLRAGHVMFTQLLDAIHPEQRRMLDVLGEGDRMPQAVFEKRLGASPYELRSRLGSLAKVCKKAKVDYPIVTAGSTRETRVFSLPVQLRSMLHHRRQA